MERHDITPTGSARDQYAEALFFLNRQGEFTFANAAFAQLTGQSAAALTGRPLLQLLALADRPAAGPLLGRALQGAVLTFELPLPNPTGQLRELVVHTFPLFDGNELSGMGGVIRADNTASDGIKAIQNREKHLSVIFRSIVDIIFVLEPKLDGRWKFLFINKAFELTTGLATEKVVGRYVQDIIPESALSLVLAHFRQAAETRQRVSWLETFDYSTGPFTGEISVTPVLNDSGACCQLVGIAHDMTAQMRVEEALRDSNERFKYALKATSDALYDWNVLTDTLHWGEGFEELFGYNLEKNPTPFAQWSDYVYPDDVPQTVDSLLHTAHQTQQARWQREYRFKRADGNWALVFDRGYIIRDEKGQAIRMIGAMQDITERREAEEKQQSMGQELSKQYADLQQFTYIISHNLRAPLANALGYANLLPRLERGSDEYIGSLQNLQISMQQLDTIISDVTAMLSVRDKPEVSYTEPIGLAAMCEQVAHSLADALLSCDGTITCAIPADLRVAGNRAYFHSIFYNLLSNAIKYRSEQRPLHVVVRGSRSTTTPGLVITVADNGSGFDLERAGADVFQLYKRFHTTHQGRGMGLFLVKSQVEAMGGRVEVRSSVDAGTTFMLYFS